jgi:hypothetical protein
MLYGDAWNPNSSSDTHFNLGISENSYKLGGLLRPKLPLLPDYTVLSDLRVFARHYDPCWYIKEWREHTPQIILAIREAEVAVVLALLEY